MNSTDTRSSADEPLEHEAEVMAAWRDRDDDGPPAAVDAAVLRSAATALNEGRRGGFLRGFRNRWLQPMATVAALGACLAVVVAVMQSAPSLVTPPPETELAEITAAAGGPTADTYRTDANAAPDNKSAARLAPGKTTRVEEFAVTTRRREAPQLDEFAAVAPAGALASRRKRVLVLGGTGRLGAEIIARLDPDSFDITVLARPTSSRERLSGLSVDYVTGDLLERESLQTALAERRFEYVIDASARRNHPGKFYAIAMQNLLAALRDTGVQQFILHGSIGAGESASVFSADMYARMRGVMQDKTAAETLLQASGIPFTIIRNGIIKPEGTPATGSARLTDDTATMGAVTRPDLAELTLECLGVERCLNTTLHAIDPHWDAN